MMSDPIRRPGVYDLYWRFAAERHAAFGRRVRGSVAPWTTDPILQRFKFCNVYRAADRVSQYLIREIAYSEEPAKPVDRLFQIVAFRMFSRIETWRHVRDVIGHSPTLEDLRDGTLACALDAAKAKSGTLYTGAFILCAADAYGQGSKHYNHVALFQHMFLQDNLGEWLLDAGSLQEVYDLLHQYPLMGDFMSYQIAIDLNYSSFINFSENDFTKPGPGALRGIKKAFVTLGSYSPVDVIFWMTERQETEFARLDLEFDGLWGRPLHAIDCQGLFCEFDKYCRVAIPELASARRRIKARFTPRTEPMQLFFPPKWGINARLPRRMVYGRASGSEVVQERLL